MKKINATYVVVAIIIAIGIVGYGYVNYKKKEMELEYQRELYNVNTTNLDNCLLSASETYYASWDSSCRRLGMESRCSLSAETARVWMGRFENDKKNCYNAFPK